MSEVILETKEHIKRVFPRTDDIGIKIDRDADGGFITKIHVKAKKQIFHAVKKDSNFKRSLRKSYQAIIHQIQKMKTKAARR